MKALFIIALIFSSALWSCGSPAENDNNGTTSSGPPISPRVPYSAAPDPRLSQDGSAKDTQSTLAKQDNQKEQIEKPFRKELKSGKVSFLVSTENDKGTNQLTIKTQGFESMNETFTHKINGQITNAEVADLNKDGFPELYVFYASAGGNKEGDVIAYGSNRNKSATPIYVRHPAKTAAAMKGYSGSDKFYIEENKLIREFAVKDNSGNETKQKISYKLTLGETSYILEMDKLLKN